MDGINIVFLKGKKSNHMKSIHLVIAIIFGISLSFMSLNTISPDQEPRKEKWAKIEENIQQRKDPKTTLEWCKELLNDIEKGNYPDEEVKAKLLIHYLNYELSDDTDQLNQQIIQEIDEDISKSKFPQKNYMAFFGLQLIEDYINDSSWEIERRKNDNFNASDISTWKMDDFNKKANTYKAIAFKQSEQLNQIPLQEASHLFVQTKQENDHIKTVYQALLYLDLQFQKRKLYDEELSSLDIEDAFSEITSNQALQQFIDDNKRYRNSFNQDIEAQLQMEFWAHLMSLQQTPKIEEIYLNNLVALGTNRHPTLQAEKDYRIALVYYSKANKISWQSLKNSEDIDVLKREKTTQFNKAISYLDKITNILNDQKSKRSEELLSLSNQLKNKITNDISLNINGKQSYLTQQDLVFSINSRNLENLNLEVYKLNAYEYQNKIDQLNWNERNNILSHIKNKTKVWDGKYSIDYSSQYTTDKRQIIVPELEYGFYALTLKGDHNKSFFFQVSDLYVERKGKEISVRSAKDYSVVKNATFCIGSQAEKCLKFDKNGVLNYHSNKNEFYSIVHSTDSYHLFNQHLGYYKGDNSNHTYFQDQIFTDRAIYRPGQKVQIKIQQKRKTYKQVLYALSEGKKVEVELRDAQYNLIKTQKVSLNEFSSGHTSFILPKDIPNGRFTISTDNGSQEIQVEEYKRPTFYINIEKDSTEKQLGDLIKLPVLSKTYSGLPLAEAKIEYTIKYNNLPTLFWRCGFYNWSEPYILNHQKQTLDKDGRFTIEINSNDIPDAMKENNLIQFTVEAKIIDQNGDSEVENTTFILSNEGVKFKKPNNFKAEEHTIFEPQAVLSNFQNLPLKRSVEYKIWSLEQPNVIYQDFNLESEKGWLLPVGYTSPKGLEHIPQVNAQSYDTWKTNKLIRSGNIISNQENDANFTFTPGVYKVIYSTKDVKGKIITQTQYVTVYPNKGKNLLKDENIFVSTNQISYKVGDTFKANIHLPFSSNYTYILSDFNGILASGEFKGNGIVKLNQAIKERSKGGLILHIHSVYNNKVYNHTTSRMVDWELNLETKWVNIRHKIQPQSKEIWQLEIKNSSGKIEETDVLAFMYDASLDKIKKHQITDLIDSKPRYWSHSYQKEHLKSYFRSNLSISNFPLYSNELNTLSGVHLDPTLSIFGINSYRRLSKKGLSDVAQALSVTTAGIAQADAGSSLSVRGGRSEETTYFVDGVKVLGNPNFAVNEIALITNGIPAEYGDITSGAISISQDNQGKSTQIRRNFNETVFFYPELRTDQDGMVNIPFTMTDGVGKYKLMVYGYTKDFKQFYVEEDILANKELMAELHKPRFLYSGDEMIWTGKISNLSKETQVTQVQLNLSNALTGDILFNGSSNQKELTLQPGESKTVSWTYKVPSDLIGEIKYELRAENEKFVDIEINQIPVLTNQTRILENFALTIPANTTKQYKLEDLLNATNFEEFRIECMTNPIWQAIKALPYSKSSDDKIISNLLDEYITIKIGEHILNKNPKIAEKLLKLTQQSPNSTLRNKSALKAITLEESPWLNEAQSQEDEMRQLANFFDQNHLNNRLKTLVRKIKSHQNASGGFSWIKGGKDSYYMSLYVLKSISNLEKLSIQSKDLNPVKTSLISYLDGEILKKYTRLKTNNTLKNIKISHLSYLETRTYFLNAYTIKGERLTAYNFFLDRALKHWTKANFVDRIALAKVAHGNGQFKIADSIFNTLDEYKLENKDQQTIYWKKLANGLSWNNRKFVNHADLIHLYTLQNRPQSEIVKLQNWLLQQKRSQHWGSSSETSQLIYALLLNVNDENLFNPVKVDIKINGKPIQFSQSEGWLSKSWFKNKGLDLNKATLEVTNTAQHPIWLSGYQNYFTSISDVKAEKTSDIALEKTFYKRQMTNQKETWVKTNLNDLTVGDEVKVNMSLTVPQQLDFVYLQDYFGACFEPTDRLSGFKYQGYNSYYLNIKDQKMQFFFDRISRGTYEFEFKTRVKQKGDFSNGFAEFQSYYAPEFGGHSSSQKVQVK